MWRFFLPALAVSLLPASTFGQNNERGYRIGAKDLLSIQVYELPSISGDQRVSEDGKLTLPLVGEIPVAGLTTSEIESVVKDLLESKFLQRGRATVAVEVRELRSRPINIIGAVKDPGPLDLAGSWTLLEALSAAGGVTSNSGVALYILRRAENGLTDQIEIALDELLIKGNQRLNLPIYDGDLINVPEAIQVNVSCLGEVEEPGVVSFKSSERMTLLAAIARAGGLSDRAARKVVIQRLSPYGGAPQEIVVDYRQLIAGKLPDPVLQAGDVIIVKQSFL